MAAMCVQVIDVHGVLQFTLNIAVSCALHRYTIRVIHRIQRIEALLPKQIGRYSSVNREDFNCAIARNDRAKLRCKPSKLR